MKQFRFYLTYFTTALTWYNGERSRRYATSASELDALLGGALAVPLPLATTYSSEKHSQVGSIQDNLLIQDMEIINAQIDMMKRVHNADNDPEILQVLKAVFGDGLNLGEVQSMVNTLSDVKATVSVASIVDSLVGCEGLNDSKEPVQIVWDKNHQSGHATAVQIPDSLYQDSPDIQALAILSRATTTLEGMGTRDFWKLDSTQRSLVPVSLEEYLSAQDSERNQFVNGNLAHDYLAVYSWAQPDLLHKNAANWGVFGYVLAYKHFPEKLRVLDQKLPVSFLIKEPFS